VTAIIEPGMRVRLPGKPDWGIGQVQSVAGDRITVNFEHAGKVLINAALVVLEFVEDDRR
jgi:FKBP-type peptidyl-prolyl cis-trans isomerase 2